MPDNAQFTGKIDQTINITADHCPMTFVKTKLALERLSAGQVLEVVLSAGEPLDNVPKTAAAQGYQVLVVEPAGTNHRVVIRKP